MSNLSLTQNGTDRSTSGGSGALFITNGSLLLLLGLCTTMLNGILLVTLTKDPLHSLNRPLYKLDFALVLSHFGAGVIALPYLGISEILHGTAGVHHEAARYRSLGGVLVNFIIGFRMLILLATLCERYTAFLRPHLNNRLTSTKARVTSILLACTCVLLDMVQFMDVSEDAFYGMYFLLLISFPVFGCIALMVATYWGIKSERSAHRVENGLPPNQEQINRAKTQRTRRANKYIVLAAIVNIPLIVCVLPWYVLQILKFHCGQCFEKKVVSVFQKFSLSLLLAETTVTPLTSIFKFPEYRQAVKRVVCGPTN